MALLIFFGSSGLSMDVHFCQGKVKKINLLDTINSCSEVCQTLSKCHQSENNFRSNSLNGKDDGCCKNQSFSYIIFFN